MKGYQFSLPSLIKNLLAVEEIRESLTPSQTTVKDKRNT